MKNIYSQKPKLFYIMPFVIIALFLITSIFYRCQFSENFSSNNSDWGDFGDYMGGILAPVLSAVSLLIAFYLLYKSNQDEKFDHIYKFMDDYRSKQMGDDLKTLWDFYNKQKSKFIKADKEKQKEESQFIGKAYKKEHEKKDKIYHARRNVSYFFVYLSIFLQENKLNKRILFTLWPHDSFDILEKIIIPCEKVLTARPNKLKYFTDLIAESKKFKKNNQATT